MRGRLIALFLVVLAAAFANGRPHAEVDCVAAPYTAWSLVRAGTFDVGRYPELNPGDQYHIRPVRGDLRVSIRPPGNAIAAVPFVAPFALTRERPLSSLAMLQLGKGVGAACVAAAACLFFVVCRRLAPAGAWPATVLFAFGTCLFSVASQSLWMHGPAVFWLCAALYLLTGERREEASRLFASGFALGLAVLARPSTAFFAAATVTALVARGRWRSAAVLALGGVIPAVCLFCYNWHYFGNIAVGGYQEVDWNSRPPLWMGLGGLLIAPSRGVLAYSPALLFAIHGAVCLWRRKNESADPTRAIIISWLFTAVGTLLFYARWIDWRGGWCYGPRYLCELMPIACLLFAISYESLRTRWMRGIAIALVAVSVAIHFVGVHGYGGYAAWHLRHQADDQGLSLFDLNDTQIEAHTRSCLREFGKKLR